MYQIRSITESQIRVTTKIINNPCFEIGLCQIRDVTAYLITIASHGYHGVSCHRKLGRSFKSLLSTYQKWRIIAPYHWTLCGWIRRWPADSLLWRTHDWPSSKTIIQQLSLPLSNCVDTYLFNPRIDLRYYLQLTRKKFFAESRELIFNIFHFHVACTSTMLYQRPSKQFETGTKL